jgi:uncharacterized membrane protein
MNLHSGVVYAFSLIGLIDTLYLSYHAVNKTDVVCWFFPKEWCQKVQYSKFSKTFGIPNPYLGFLMYIALLVLTPLTVAGAVGNWLVPAIIMFGFAFSMYFTFIQAFVLRAFCTWCVISAINFTVMFIYLWK